MARKIPRHDRAVDAAPGSDIHSCHVVGGASEPAPNALDFFLETHLVSGLDAERGRCSEVAILIGPFHRFRQSGLLLLVGERLDLMGREHGGMICFNT
ncbi:hypothetical protein [Methanomassiliicoccus luminyensis]|jgi:hypothetical protein|uniref:hypothetical protein n=1 Tax=Methanomassiliicoccus luminyensis TaxID=1080712 RepID=UPI0011CA21A2|nr:hypothetical protein [Methanomassiliicoccus luminyensis]